MEIFQRHTHRRWPGGGTPFRATAAENILRGQIFNVESLNHALESLLTQAQFVPAPAVPAQTIRRLIVDELFKDVLETAWGKNEARRSCA